MDWNGKDRLFVSGIHFPAIFYTHSKAIHPELVLFWTVKDKSAEGQKICLKSPEKLSSCGGFCDVMSMDLWVTLETGRLASPHPGVLAESCKLSFPLWLLCHLKKTKKTLFFFLLSNFTADLSSMFFASVSGNALTVDWWLNDQAVLTSSCCWCSSSVRRREEVKGSVLTFCRDCTGSLSQCLGNLTLSVTFTLCGGE